MQTMPIQFKSSATPLEMPVVHLEHWALITIPSVVRKATGYYLVGIARETGLARVTTEIVEMDPVKKVAETLSGRTYILVGQENVRVALTILEALEANENPLQ